MGMSVFGFVLPSDGKLCLQRRQYGHYLHAKSRCEFDKEQVIRGCVHLFRTVKRGREQDTLDLQVLCQFVLAFTSLR